MLKLKMTLITKNSAIIALLIRLLSLMQATNKAIGDKINEMINNMTHNITLRRAANDMILLAI